MSSAAPGSVLLSAAPSDSCSGDLPSQALNNGQHHSDNRLPGHERADEWDDIATMHRHPVQWLAR
jgi:hypothetical protein